MGETAEPWPKWLGARLKFNFTINIYIFSRLEYLVQKELKFLNFEFLQPAKACLIKSNWI